MIGHAINFRGPNRVIYTKESMKSPPPLTQVVVCGEIALQSGLISPFGLAFSLFMLKKRAVKFIKFAAQIKII